MLLCRTVFGLLPKLNCEKKNPLETNQDVSSTLHVHSRSYKKNKTYIKIIFMYGYVKKNYYKFTYLFVVTLPKCITLSVQAATNLSL